MSLIARQWEPGDVAMVTCSDGKERRAICGRRAVDDGRVWLFRDGTRRDAEDSHARPLVVIDPEDREQVERLHTLWCKAITSAATSTRQIDSLQAALREFANRIPAEPTDPATRVTDRRENIWRLLADGDWVCTSGPDIGEYLAWSRLAAERGPLEVDL